MLADAFLAGLADCLQGEPMSEAGNWLAALGKHLPEEVHSPGRCFAALQLLTPCYSD